MPGDQSRLGDRFILPDGRDVYLPPVPTERASLWAQAIGGAPPEIQANIVQALLDNEVARIMKYVEASLDMEA